LDTATIQNMPPAQPDYGSRRSGGSGDLRHGNLTQILRYVRDHGASSRHDIARGCGLGISTMTDLIGELRSRRLVRELDPIRRPGAGRPTRPIAFDGEPWCVLGVHLDLDQVEFAASTVGGRELWTEAVPADLRNSGPEGYPRIAELLRSQLTRIPADQELIAVEIGVSGSIAADRRTVSLSSDIGWRDFDLGGAVAGTLAEAGLDHAFVGVSNECQLSALYATRFELALPGDAIAVYLGGSRTLGGAVIIGGEIFRGAWGGAGEFGHLNVDPLGPTCWCGRSGCLESLIGPVTLLVNAKLASGSEARQLVDQDRDKANLLVAEAAEAGDKQVGKVLSQAGSVLGGAIDDIVGVVNPHAVVLGGFLGVLSPYLLPRLRERLAQRLATPAYAETQILTLEGLAPRTVNGATLAARDACFYAPLALTRPVS
jgi:predicted NBD/HSP70 family sugar kinase